MSTAAISFSDAPIQAVATADAPAQPAAPDASTGTQPFATVFGQAITQGTPAHDTTPAEGSKDNQQGDKKSGSGDKKKDDLQKAAPTDAQLAQLVSQNVPAPPPEAIQPRVKTEEAQVPPQAQVSPQMPVPAEATGKGAVAEPQATQQKPVAVLPTVHKENVPSAVVSSKPTPVESCPVQSEAPQATAVELSIPDPQLASHAKTTQALIHAESGQTDQSLPSVAVAGTASAIKEPAMKTQAKVEGSSRNVEKNLPSGHILPELTARAISAPDKPEFPSAKSERGANPTISSDASAARLTSLTVEKPAVLETSPRVEDVRPASAEKVAAEISDRVVAFKRVGADSLDVSIRPDRGTELSLQLSMRDGQVEVAARLERGNFQNLQAHWSGLQQSLSQQGIRVGQLVDTNAGGQTSSQQSFGQSTSQSTGQSAGQSPERRQRPSEGLDDSPLAGATAEPLKGRSSRVAASKSRGWEMWA